MIGLAPIDEERHHAISERIPGRSHAPGQNNTVGSLAIPRHHFAESHTALHSLRAQTIQICSLGRPRYNSRFLEALKPPWRPARLRLFRICLLYTSDAADERS